MLAKHWHPRRNQCWHGAWREDIAAGSDSRHVAAQLYFKNMDKDVSQQSKYLCGHDGNQVRVFTTSRPELGTLQVSAFELSILAEGHSPRLFSTELRPLTFLF